MEVTGLPSGTVYPALRRLERDALVESQWESDKEAAAGQRPARRYYQITKPAAARAATERYPLLARLVSGGTGEALMRLAPQHARHSQPTLSRCDLFLLRVGASLVPAADRDDWRRNWYARASGTCTTAAAASTIFPAYLPACSATPSAPRRELAPRLRGHRPPLPRLAHRPLPHRSIRRHRGKRLGTFRTLIASHLIRFLIESPLIVAVTFATSSSRYIDQRTTGYPLCWLRRQLFPQPPRPRCFSSSPSCSASISASRSSRDSP